jgi:hypothetical protein
MFTIEDSMLIIYINLNTIWYNILVTIYVIMFSLMMFELYYMFGFNKFLKYLYMWIFMSLCCPVFFIVRIFNLQIKFLHRLDTFLYYLCKPENNFMDAIQIEKEIQQQRIFK